MKSNAQDPVPESATISSQASSVPKRNPKALLDRPPLEAGRLAERVARNAMAGVPEARSEVIALALAATERIYSHSVERTAHADTSLIVMEMLTPALGQMRRNETLTPGQAQFLASRLEQSARDWLELANANVGTAVGVGRMVGANGETAMMLPYQSAGLLRALAELSPGGRIRPEPKLARALIHAAAAHPSALGPGVLSEVLHPAEPASVDAVRVALQSSGRLSRPAAPPRVLVQAAAAGLGEDVPGEIAASPWVEVARRWSAPDAEIFAAAVAAHPGLSAGAAENLHGRMADPGHPRAGQRMWAALDSALNTLCTRLKLGPDGGIDPILFGAGSPAWSDPARRLSTVRAIRTLAVASGRGDRGADGIARETLALAQQQPHRFTGPLVAAAGVAASLVAPEMAAGAETTSPDRTATPLSTRIAIRLAEGLARALEPFGDSARWARGLARRWSESDHAPSRRQAWSALTLAAELVADGRVPAARPELMTRLLREAGTGAEISEMGEGADLVAHRRRMEAYLDRVAATPLPISVALGAETLPVAVSFVPGWRLGLSLEAADRARRQPGWQPRQGARWLEPGTVAVLAEGEVCGWIQPGNGPMQFLGEGVLSAVGPGHDWHEEQMRSVMLVAAAVAVAAEQGVGVRGAGLTDALATLGRYSGDAELQQLGGTGRTELSAEEVQLLAAGTGWRAPEVDPASLTLTTEPEAADTVENPRVARGRGR